MSLRQLSTCKWLFLPAIQGFDSDRAGHSPCLCTITARAVAVQASRRACAAEGITAEDTAGFKYVPGGRKLPGKVFDRILSDATRLHSFSFVHRL